MAFSVPFFIGVLGNIVSFMVFLSPAPTFYKIYKDKATQGFDPIPYSVALFSCMLTGYYGFVKQSNGLLIITINAVGIGIEFFYLAMFLVFAPRRERLKTIKMIMSFNVGLLGVIILLTALVAHGAQRECIVGWICAICSICVFASPLCAIRTVIKTKSVEFMPFWLSLSLTFCAIIWFCYGFFIKDLYVALPNVLGFLFGMAQMALYFIYKDSKKDSKKDSSAIASQGKEELPLSNLPTDKKLSEMVTVLDVQVAVDEGEDVVVARSCAPVNAGILEKPLAVECVV